MKTHKILIFIALLFIAISSCKKYPDGGMGLASIERQWDVTHFSINGYDSTDYLRNQPFYYRYNFYSEGRCQCSGLSGNWVYIDKKKSIYIHLNNYTIGSIGPYRANDVTWEILRLNQKELWLKTIFSGKEYIVKFKPV